MPQKSEDEKKRVILRTTADVLLNTIAQLEACVQEWPQYIKECNELRELSGGIVQAARDVGYIGRGLNARK